MTTGLMNKKAKKYSFAFTTGASLLNETLKVLNTYLETKDWKTCRTQVVEENILQKKAEASRSRMFSECSRRLKSLTPPQMELFANGSHDEQVCMNFLAISKTYAVIYDYVVEILRNKLLLYEFSFNDFDFDDFLYDKEELHPEIKESAGSTKNKARQFTHMILDEISIVNLRSMTINPFILPAEVIRVIIKDNPSHLRLFLMSDTDIKIMTGKYG
ncbi:MAG: DUF1819 family protein [Lentisphaeraceae bacterium]|nr:DUF1819 family protein [Lentisphaeraceae bacterium]